MDNVFYCDLCYLEFNSKEKMNFRPKKWKIIVAVIVIVIWYAVLFINASMIMCDCKPCASIPSEDECGWVLDIDLLPEGCEGCRCGCPEHTPISKILEELIIILLPGIIVYVIWSLIEKKK